MISKLSEKNVEILKLTEIAVGQLHTVYSKIFQHAFKCDQ